MCNCVVEVTAKMETPEHWRWWIQNRKAKLKQERKQPPITRWLYFLENRND